MWDLGEIIYAVCAHDSEETRGPVQQYSNKQANLKFKNICAGVLLESLSSSPDPTY